MELSQLFQQAAVAQLIQLSQAVAAVDSVPIPPSTQAVIDAHSEAFKEPVDLPPARSFDHSIPLILDVVPVHKKPYRYAPSQKYELERQIQDMLDRELIQPSSSPYASSVILVKRKDGGGTQYGVKHSIQVRDEVYLKLHPYVQPSVARRSNQKLSYKFFGPYKILQKVGVVAYKLQLSPWSHIRPVVNVSLLKKAIPAHTTPEPDLSAACMSMEAGIQSLNILNTKLIAPGSSSTQLVQEQWSSMLAHLLGLSVFLSFDECSLKHMLAFGLQLPALYHILEIGLS